MAQKSVLLSVDLGTTFTKAGAYSLKGELLATATRKAKSEMTDGNAFIQYGEAFLMDTVEVLREVVQQIGSVKIEAIGFTGQMAGMIGVDENFNAVTIWSGTIDGRQQKYMKDISDAYADRMLILSGTNSPFMASKIRWIQNEEPEQFAKVQKYLVLTGFVIGRLASLQITDAFIDKTYLTWTGLADLLHNDWSPELCYLIGIDIRRLPKVVPCNSVVGYLSPEYADMCGLPSGIPLVAGAGDKPAGCLAVGAFEQGMLVDECSSVGALSLCVNQFTPDLKFKTLEIIPSALPDQYYALSFLTGSGLASDWFVKTFGTGMEQEAMQQNKSIFDIFDEKAFLIPAGAQGLSSISVLWGRALPSQPYIKGAFIGHDWRHTPAHFYRAFLEGLAYEFGYFLWVMKRTYPDVALRQVRAIGGGAKSNLSRKIKTDVLALPYESISRSDSSLIGVTLLAGNAIGVFSDIKQTAMSFIEISHVETPDSSTVLFYQTQIEAYQKLLSDLEMIYRTKA